MKLKQFSEIFDQAQTMGVPALAFYLFCLLVNKVYAFKLRRTPLKVNRRYFPDGSLKEVTEEFRN